MKNKLLKIQNTEIPILYQPPYEIRLSRCRVKIPTNQTEGEALLNLKDVGKGVRIPSALITCKEGFAETILQNTSAEQLIISIKKPFTPNNNNNNTPQPLYLSIVLAYKKSPELK
ncbi:unnamed protein product [Chilo suppressalis]|uniref:Uncharacterized protein n=1 Tax=Chilo suppressalis TaxID=168631 RepID=A0ABN8B3U8_CHISP|nr:unnamed protein product [Chilo suppressalis]